MSNRLSKYKFSTVNDTYRKNRQVRMVKENKSKTGCKLTLARTRCAPVEQKSTKLESSRTANDTVKGTD